MPEVTNELMYELLNRMHGDLPDVKFDVQHLKKRMTNTEEGIAGVNRRLARQDDRLERMEHRLELRELAEQSQSSYEPPRP